VGTSQLIEGSWTVGFKMLALGEDERFRSMDRMARAAAARWERVRAGREAADAARLAIPYDAIRRRAAYRAGQQLPDPLARVLAQRIGIPFETLRTPPPQVALPPPQERDP
jgi:hypothetical protein